MTKTKLHPGARWLFRVGMFFSLIFLSFFIAMFTATFWIGIFAEGFAEGSVGLGTMFLIWISIVFILMIIGEIWVRMAYNRWFYEFTDTNLKLERGVIWKRYSNVPYERVQNVDIHRGIIARMLGFSSLNIQTAGYSVTSGGHGGVGSEGYIPAINVEDAEKIRDFLMKKISKRHSQSGL